MFKRNKLRIEFLLGIENADISAFLHQALLLGMLDPMRHYLNMDPEECLIQFCKESGLLALQSEINGTKKNKVVKATKHLDDPILNPQIPKKKIQNGKFNNFSISGLFSLTALLLLILGLGYGGVTVLNEVQKVNLSPLNQLPSIQTNTSTSIK